jgi:hypothetical protein
MTRFTQLAAFIVLGVMLAALPVSCQYIDRNGPDWIKPKTEYDKNAQGFHTTVLIIGFALILTQLHLASVLFFQPKEPGTTSLDENSGKHSAAAAILGLIAQKLNSKSTIGGEDTYMCTVCAYETKTTAGHGMCYCSLVSDGSSHLVCKSSTENPPDNSTVFRYSTSVTVYRVNCSHGEKRNESN